jgi:hypothetical protein
MTDFHLDNVIAVLTRVCAQRPYTQEVYAGDDWWQEQEIDPSQQDCNGLTYAEWLDVMSMERKRRQDRDTLSKGG